MFDLPLSAWFQANRHPVITDLLLLVTHWHGTAGVLLMSAALALVLSRLGRPWWLLALLASVPGGMLLNFAVKNLVQRARPHLHEPAVALTSYSFPSGHTAGTALFYGFLAAFVFAQPGWRHWRAPVAAFGTVMVLLVGLSRIYLGVHYLTDVVGALILAGLWLGLCLAGTQVLSRRAGSGVAHG